MNRRSMMMGGAALVGAAPAVVSVLSPLAASKTTIPGIPKPAWSGSATDPATPALRLGPENNFAPFSGQTTVSQMIGQKFGGLGPALSRAVKLPINYANIPASGDHWLLLFFRTGAIGSFLARQETLLGVQGYGPSSGAISGALSFNSAVALTGSATGIDLSLTAGNVQCQRRIGSFQLWPQPTVGSPTSINLLADTDYALFFGIQNIGGADYGQMILVNLTDLSAQQTQSPWALSAQRPSGTPMYDQLGALGYDVCTKDDQGFGGSLGDFAVFSTTFPTVAQAQYIASGAIPMVGAQGVAAYLGQPATSLLYWNTLDPTTANSGVIAAQVGPPALLLGANLVSSAPVRKAAPVTLRRMGAYYVFPIAAGKTSGAVWFEGVAPPGQTVSCQINYINGTTSSPTSATADANGNFVASISSPGGQPFTRQASLTSGGGVFVDGDIMDVGIVIPLIGQSEVNVLNTWSGSITPPAPSDASLGNAGHSLPMPGSYTGPWASWVDQVQASNGGTGYIRSHGEGVRPQIMCGNGFPGDGTVEACTKLMAATGLSVMTVMLTRSGHPMDAVLWDGQTFTVPQTFKGSGSAASPYQATLAVSTSVLNSAFPAYPGMVLVPFFLNQAQPGSVTITFPNNGNPVVVTDSFPGYTDGTTCKGTLSGGNGASGTIDYMTGQISLSFTTSTPSSSASATWTVMQQTQNASYKSVSAKINGFGCRQAVDQIGNAALRYGWTVSWIWWITSNLSEISSVAVGTQDLTGKITLLQQMMTGGPKYPGYLAKGLSLDPGCANPPMLLSPKGRETGAIEMETPGRYDVARQAQISLWPNGSNPLPFVLAGNWYLDHTMDAPTGTGHSADNDQGARRIGRRMACDWLAGFKLDRTINRGPEFGPPVFSGNICTLPVAYIGAGLTLVTPGNASALSEWYAQAPGQSAPEIVDNATWATAAIGSDGLSVVITNLNGPWLGTELIYYIVGAPGDTVSDVYAPPSLLYDNRGGFDGFELGLPAAPLYPPLYN